MTMKNTSINWNKCLERAANDPEMARTILSMFITDLNEARPKIKQAFTEKNYSEMQKHIHKLHGGSYFSGIPNLTAILLTLDTLLKNTEEPTQLQMQTFENECDDLLNCYSANQFEEPSS